RQLEESHSGVPAEATTTEVNLEPRSRRHGRLLAEAAPTTKVTCSPGPYRCRAVRRVSSTAPLAQVCRPGPGVGAVLAPRGAAGGRARGRDPRFAVCRVRAWECPRAACRRAPGPVTWPEWDRGGPWLPPNASFTAQMGRPSIATPAARTTTRRRQ